MASTARTSENTLGLVFHAVAGQLARQTADVPSASSPVTSIVIVGGWGDGALFQRTSSDNAAEPNSSMNLREIQEADEATTQVKSWLPAYMAALTPRPLISPADGDHVRDCSSPELMGLPAFREPPGLSLGNQGSALDHRDLLNMLSDTRLKLVYANRKADAAMAEMTNIAQKLRQVQQLNECLRWNLVEREQREENLCLEVAAVVAERDQAVSQLRAVLQQRDHCEREARALRSECVKNHTTAIVRTNEEKVLLRSAIEMLRLELNARDERLNECSKIVTGQTKAITNLKAKLRQSRQERTAVAGARENLHANDCPEDHIAATQVSVTTQWTEIAEVVSEDGLLELETGLLEKHSVSGLTVPSPPMMPPRHILTKPSSTHVPRGSPSPTSPPPNARGHVSHAASDKAPQRRGLVRGALTKLRRMWTGACGKVGMVSETLRTVRRRDGQNVQQ
ncbi:hypothetical protein HDU93_005282 [Gonapodya sp. JEL0774]|nr:hypothetical protein HDU93_005282 [Gonapodya sp. JEL0774]